MGMQTRIQRACQDTEGFRAWKRELLVAVIAGALCWWWLPEQEAVSEITAISIAVVAAILIAPLIEFCWNYYRAPLRILTDENASLRAQLLEYQSTSSKETLNINGIEIKGRWFGDRFILDNEVCVLANYSVREDPIPAFLSSPANALVSLRYKIEGFLIVRLGGNKDTGQIVEQATGVIEIPTDEKRSVYYSNVQGNGDLNLWVLGWIEGGKK